MMLYQRTRTRVVLGEKFERFDRYVNYIIASYTVNSTHQYIITQLDLVIQDESKQSLWDCE